MECMNCGKFSGEERHCLECEDQNYHCCEDCGKSIKESKYSVSLGGLVCSDCEHKHFIKIE